MSRGRFELLTTRWSYAFDDSPVKGFRSFVIQAVYSLGPYKLFVVTWQPTCLGEDQDEVALFVTVKGEYYYTCLKWWYATKDSTKARPRRLLRRQIWHYCQAYGEACAYLENSYGLAVDRQRQIDEITQELKLRQKAADQLVLPEAQEFDRILDAGNGSL